MELLHLDYTVTHSDLIQMSVRVCLVDSILESRHTDSLTEILANGNGRIFVGTKIASLEKKRFRWIRNPIIRARSSTER